MVTLVGRGDAERREGRKCVAEGCRNRIGSGKVDPVANPKGVSTHVFCPDHWGKIPRETRLRLFDLYTPGQFGERDGPPSSPTREWLQTVEDARERLAGRK